MKKFQELTIAQQALAIDLIVSEMAQLMQMGLIYFKKKPSDQKMRDYAEHAAHESLYCDSGERVVEDIAV